MLQVHQLRRYNYNLVLLRHQHHHHHLYMFVDQNRRYFPVLVFLNHLPMEFGNYYHHFHYHHLQNHHFHLVFLLCRHRRRLSK